MRKLVLAVAVVAGLLGSGRPAVAQTAQEDGAAPRKVDPKKAADIRKLIELTGGAALAKQMMTQMLPALKKMVPEAPDSFWDECMDEFDQDGLVALVVPIYDKHLSAEDVKALLTFYQSPSGQRVIKALPAIMAESMTAGQEWGQQIARRVLRRAEQHHYREGKSGDE